MSRHEGVSCDSCLKSNFRGRRYKCLICYDFDLCANCYQEGIVSSRHQQEHPMQAILTRSDYELYYAGENISPEQPQSFTCPYCGRLGFTEALLLEHVTSEHTDTGLEVVCPICAALPGGDPNLVTDDFAGHLSLEHRTGSRDLISFLDEPSAIRHGGVRRIPHSGRALGGPRSRRSNMHFSTSGGGLSTLSPSGRESVDPIAELLQQLSGVRRGAPQPSQLQQLQMQIQLERQQVSAARQQLERLPRRQAHPSTMPSSSNGGTLTTNPASGIASLNGNLREGNITSTMPLNTTSNSSAAFSAGAGGASSVTNASQTVAMTAENFQLLTPRLWEETEKLTDEQQKERDRTNYEKVKYATAAMYSALRLRDPYRYILMGQEHQVAEKERRNQEEKNNKTESVCSVEKESIAHGTFNHSNDSATASKQSLTQIQNKASVETHTSPQEGIGKDMAKINVQGNHEIVESAESLGTARKPVRSPRSAPSSNKSQVKSGAVNMQNTDSR